MPAKHCPSSSGLERLISHPNPNLTRLGKATIERFKHVFEVVDDKHIDGLKYNSPFYELYSEKGLKSILEKKGIFGVTTSLPEPVVLALPTDSFEICALKINNTKKGNGNFQATLSFSSSLPIVYETNEFSPDNVETLLHRVTMLALIPSTVLEEVRNKKHTVIIINPRTEEEDEKVYESSNLIRLKYDGDSGAIHASIVYPDKMSGMEKIVEERQKVVQESDKVFFLVD